MTNPLHIVCPHCLRTNRVQQQHLEKAPNCGNCKQALFTAHPVALNEESFDRHVARSQIPVLVSFGSDWYENCRVMAPAYDQAAARLEPHARVAKVDSEACAKLVQRFRIRRIPTLLLFVEGREVARQPGSVTSASQIVQWTRLHMNEVPFFG